MSGAISPGEVKRILSDLGFQGIDIVTKAQTEEIIKGWNVGGDAEKAVFSAYLTAWKAHD